MKKSSLFDLLTLVAFFNNNGWKLDADGKIAVDGEGNPIYLDSSGKQVSVRSTHIATLNAESKSHREAREAAEKKLAAFVDTDGKPLDPKAAVEAIRKLAEIDLSKLVESGKLDEVRTQITAEAEKRIAAATGETEKIRNELNALKIDSVFTGEFMDRLAMPPEFFKAAMRSHFSVDENGRIVAKDAAGNVVMSAKRMGEVAEPSEALSMLVDARADKDSILKAPSSSGSGAAGGGGGAGGNKSQMRRADFEKLAPVEQAKIATGGEVTIVD